MSKLYISHSPNNDSRQYGRKKKRPKLKSFRLNKQNIHRKPVKSGTRIFLVAIKLIARNLQFYLPVIIIYGFLYYALVKNFSYSVGLEEVKTDLQSTVLVGEGRFSQAVSLLLSLYSLSAELSTEVAVVYQLIILGLMSLSSIWLCRQLSSKSRPRIRDAFYVGTARIVPFLIIVVTLILELLPIVIGVTILNNATATEIDIKLVDHLILWSLLLALFVLSSYMVTGSILALQIITLNDMLPFKALQSSARIVFRRRWLLFRRLVTLLLLIMVITSAILLPLVFFWPFIAEIVLIVLTIMIVPIANIYMYLLYKDML